jgi:amino acid adenylation domain-containing protein/non-ribosomal peptide synthase protein (TIGR01720 family)
LGFVGRVDRQVKVRGFRVELGEVEGVLRGCVGVGDVVVVLLGGILTAYLTGERTATADIRAQLRRKLPEAAIPSRIGWLDSLPTNVSGKVDYNALPPLDEEESNDAEHVPPDGHVERILAGVWQTVLRRQRIGRYDNFFDVGGDSILSLLIVSKAAAEGVTLSVRQMLDHPTIAALSRVVTRSGSGSETLGVVRAPLTPIQSWLLDQGMAGLSHWNMARVLALPGTPQVAWVRDALAYVCQRHGALRSRFVTSDNDRHQYISPLAHQPVIEVVDVATEDEPVPAAVVDRLQTGLDLSYGPLLAAVLIRAASGATRLLLIIHHLVVDAVSWSMLAADIGAVLDARSRGAQLPSPRPVVSYLDWASRLAALAPTMVDEARWWTDAIPTEVPPLPVDTDVVRDLEADEQHRVIELDPPATAALLSASRKLRARLNELMLAAVAHAIASWAGRDDLLFDVEGHGREDVIDGLRIADSVGWFTTQFPLWLPGIGADVASALADVKNRYRDVPQHGIGFGVLRYHPQTAAELTALARPEILFNFLGDSDATGAGDVRITTERIAGCRDRNNVRPHRLVVDAEIADGRLRVRLAHGAAHLPSTVDQIGTLIHTALGTLTATAGEMTESWVPSDFPLAGLPAREIRRIGARHSGVADIVALTPTQEGLLFHTLLDPNRGMYVEQRAWTFDGEYEAAAWHTAWSGLTHHQVFRSLFVWEGVEHPVQVILDQAAVTIAEHDLTTLDPARQRDEVDRLLAEDQCRSIDLGAAPAMRVSVYRLAARRWMMVWTAHHLLLDGWSNAIVVAELFAGYSAAVAGTRVEVPERLPVQGFLSWRAANQVPDAADYWSEYLRGFEVATPLPLRAPAEPGSGFAEITIDLPDDLVGRLVEIARTYRLTLNSVVAGAWAMLLGRYADSDDVVFGAVSAGRPAELPGVDGMIGLCIVTLPTRARLEPDRPVLDWLSQLQDEQLRQRDYEQTPLSDIQDHSEVPRGKSLFDTLLVMENYPGVPDGLVSLADAGLTMLDEDIVSPASYRIRCCVIPHGRPRVMLGYYRDIVHADDVRHLGRQFVRLLAQFADRPDATLRDYSLVLPDVDPDPGSVLPAERYPTVPALVSAWVARTPTAIAVRQGATEWDYARLHQRVDELADVLRDAGVRPGCPVAVSGARTPGLVAGMLAVLRVDAVLVPVDPGLPRARQRAMSDAAGCRIGLVVGGSTDLDVPVIAVGADGAVVSTQPVRPPVVADYPSDVGYVMFTSGSSGTPKPVLGSHNGLSHFLVWQRDEFRIEPDDTVLQMTALSFDVVLRDVFLPLVSGATLVLPEKAEAWDADVVMNALRRERITVLHVVPTLAMSWLTHRSADTPVTDSLRTVFFAGEPLLAENVAAWRAVFGEEATLVNLYGPTETTLAACAWRVPSLPTSAVLPVGRPISGVQVLVLGPGGERQAIGQPGELVIRSPYRSHGYLGSSDDTFRHNHLATDAAADDKLYWTGDRGRLRPDGTVEYLGRDDGRIKLRGVMVDTNEVASVALRHPAVAGCTVVRGDDQFGEPTLIAYVVTHDARPDSHTSIRDHLRRTLPTVAVPSAFVTLDELPLLPSGKVNQVALPQPTFARSDEVGEYRGPSTALEERIADVWRTVMGLDRLGVTDDFFRMGGHSLIATRLVSRLRADLGVDLTMRDFFEHPTVAELAAWAAVAAPIADQRPTSDGNGRKELDAAYELLRALPEADRQRILGGR